LKTTFLLLIPKILSIRNSLTLGSLFKRLPLIFVGLVFWLAFYIGSYKVLNFIRSIEFFGETLSEKLISVTFFSLGIFLVLSNIITALSSFYLSKDLPLLMSKPIKVKEILRLKTIEAIASSSWMVVSFIPPFFIAYGVSYNAPFLFYLMLILTFIPFLLMAGGIGIAVAHLLTRIFSVKKIRLALLFTGLLLFLFAYLLVRSRWSISLESTGGFLNALIAVKTDSPLIPSFWITESVVSVLKRQPLDNLYPLLILSNSAFMLILSGAIGNRLYVNNLERIQPSIKHGIKVSKEGVFPGSNLAILWKDVKIFFRDAGQWSQLFIIFALIVIYTYNFRTIPLRALSEISPFIKEIMVLVNILMAGLVLSAVSARFLYASISLEGMAFWIIRTSPVTVKKFLWSKFLYGFIPVTVILLAVVFISNIAIGADSLLMLLSGLTLLILCISISGLGTGMGAIFHKFKYENIASISTSPGGMLFMIIAFSIVLLTVSLEAWSFYLYKKAAISGLGLSFLEKGQFVLAGLLIIILNSLTFYMPMKKGEKRLEEDLSV
jgi:ABC-2 type transport system permease protein